MGVDKLISIAATLGLLAVSTGQLPKVLHAVRLAQIHLIQDSQASKWGRVMLLPRTK